MTAPPKLPSGLTFCNAAAVLLAGRDQWDENWLMAFVCQDPAALEFFQRRLGICAETDCNQPIAGRCAHCGKPICADHSEDDHWHGKICYGTPHYQRPPSRPR